MLQLLFMGEIKPSCSFVSFVLKKIYDRSKTPPQSLPLPRLRGQAEGAGVVPHVEATRRATVAGRGRFDPWAELGSGDSQGGMKVCKFGRYNSFWKSV